MFQFTIFLFPFKSAFTPRALTANFKQHSPAQTFHCFNTPESTLTGPSVCYFCAILKKYIFSYTHYLKISRKNLKKK